MFACSENSHDHVRFYLEDLKWDGVNRLDSVLVNYAGADDTDFNRKVGKLWMMSAVARIFSAGCKADCAIILEARGAGKSPSLKLWLARNGFTMACQTCTVRMLQQVCAVNGS